MTMVTESCIHDSIFPSNSNAFASELLENIDELFYGTTCIVIYVTRPNLQQHKSVLSVSKGLIIITLSYVYTL